MISIFDLLISGFQHVASPQSVDFRFQLSIFCFWHV